jgi:hypothetical protein
MTDLKRAEKNIAVDSAVRVEMNVHRRVISFELNLNLRNLDDESGIWELEIMRETVNINHPGYVIILGLLSRTLFCESLLQYVASMNWREQYHEYHVDDAWLQLAFE